VAKIITSPLPCPIQWSLNIYNIIYYCVRKNVDALDILYNNNNMYIMCIDGALLIVIYWTYDATIIRTEIILGRRKKYIEITTATVGRFFFICLNLSFTARRVYNNNINDTPRPSVVSDFYNNNNIILLLLLPTTVAPLWRLVLRSAGVSTRIYTYITTMMMIIIISIIYA